MTDSELEALAGEVESDRVERKASLADGEKIRQAICAFANDLPNHGAPGVLFVGLNDDGSCSNLPITDDLLQALAGTRSDGNILPVPSLVVQKRVIRNCTLAVVIVQPSDAPPVRYKGRTWIRVGPRRAVASPEEERRLTEKRRSRDLSYDLRPFPTAAVDDLDLDLFRRSYLPSSVAVEVLDENQRSASQQLASLRMVAQQTAPPVPTVLGLLVLGKDPRAFLPCAYVQFLRLDGPTLADPVKDAADFSAPLSELLRLLEDKLETHIETARDLTNGPVEIQRPGYPMVALQQLVRNAILHRNYEGTNAPIRINWFSDRIEILSPGGPYGQVNKSNFGQPGVTDYRNPYLAEAMRNVGYVQKFGVGIQLARQSLAANGNPDIEFQVEDTHILATVRRRK